MSGIVWLGPPGTNTDEAIELSNGSSSDARKVIRTTAYGTVWEGATDTAQVGIELSRARAKAQEDEKPPVGDEQGSPFGSRRLFSFFQDGLVFESGPVETEEIEAMIAADGNLRAIEQALTLPIRSVSWQFKAGPKDSGELAFINDALAKPRQDGGMSVPLQTIIGQMTSACLFKRAFFEKVVVVGADGKFRYDKIAYRPPSTCYLARSADSGAFAGFMQWSWKGQAYLRTQLAAEKTFVYIHGEHRNPLEGISDLDVAYNVYKSKQRIRFLWYLWLQTMATGRFKATSTNGSSPKRKKELAASVTAMMNGGTIVLEQGEDVAGFDAGGSGEQAFQAALTYMDSEIYQSINAGFLHLTQASTRGAQGRGSNAMAESMQQWYLQSRQGVLNEMEQAITCYLVAPLIRWNFGPDASCPVFEFGKLGESDTTSEAFTLLQAITSAATPTPLLPNEFIDQLVVHVAAALDMNVDDIQAQMKTITAQRGSALTPAGILEQQGQLTAPQAGTHDALDALTTVAAQAAAAKGITPPPVVMPAPAPAKAKKAKKAKAQ